MAIFERSSQTKVQIDDTERLECVLENAQNINNHTEYILRVQRGQNKENRWTVSRRYRDFAALHVGLQQANIDLSIPPKKLIGNMQPSFVAERQVALQNYINEVLKHQVLSLSLQVRRFLDPNNYPLSITEQALQTISIALRGDGQFELKCSLTDIGWRIRKHYFLVNDTESQLNCMLSWQTYGPDCTLHSKDLQLAFKSLQNISHPYIDNVLSMHALETGAYVVRKIHENGSIRDLLYGTEYNKNYLVKYGNPKVRKPFTNGQIAHYGYQILQALKFLHSKGLCHGNVHPGNITIENQSALLMDVENFLMGVPSFYRPFLLELKRTSSAEAVDVYCFGRTLYEMAFAAPLETCYCDIYPDGISDELEGVLRLCASSESARRGPATLDALLLHPFFTRTHVDVGRTHLKFPLNLKDQLKAARHVAEERLRLGQKSVQSAKREVRIQEILNSEKEMKKQKKKARRRESVWKSSSSLADVSTASSPSPPSPPTPPAPPAPVPPPASASSRGALLSAICSFDKSRLSRVVSR
ncbi:PX domain-containing protein kinase-like protein [Nymphalis io]|uniref:PX domain-containing protein kinase-like protein n=1 Tax=Inachis io TaxID=171585 RepID=UPI0021672506|nr:PX domain-containing protein kinase-like protein [Nymphalis io]